MGIKVEGHTHLIRDEESHAIISIRLFILAIKEYFKISTPELDSIYTNSFSLIHQYHCFITADPIKRYNTSFDPEWDFFA